MSVVRGPLRGAGITRAADRQASNAEGLGFTVANVRLEGNGRLTTEYGQPSAAYCFCYAFFSYSPLLAMKLIKSRTRQEYPHSLSYQATTFTSVPSMTLVNPASIMDECGLPVKSMETNSSSTY